jgi:hypothetical protein
LRRIVLAAESSRLDTGYGGTPGACGEAPGAGGV